MGSECLSGDDLTTFVFEDQEEFKPDCDNSGAEFQSTEVGWALDDPDAVITEQDGLQHVHDADSILHRRILHQRKWLVEF